VGTKLYVGSLPYSTTDQELQNLFAPHGTVHSAKVMTDRYTGRSRGFGFIEMGSADEAQRAIAALNGTQYEGRTLVVNEAKPEVRRERSWGSDRGGGSRT
jgi:RNA recognition motif-containing protein